MKLPRMFLEIEVPTETFSAYAASERLPLIVCVHVERQVVYLVKRFVANIALVSFFSTVSESMVLVVTFLMEPFPTELANEGLVARVYTSVCI